MRRISLLLMMLAATLAAVIALSTGGTSNAQEDGPLAAVEGLVAGANESFPSGDPTAFVNAFTEDGVFTNRDDAFMAVGRPAMMVAFGFEADEAFEATLLETSVDGNVVTGSARIADQDSVDAGVGSHIELFTATEEDGLVSSFVLTYDHDDPDTVTYLEYVAGLDDGGEDEGPPPGAVEIELAGDQPGVAQIADIPDADGVSVIAIEIEPAEGPWQPAHVHTGTCEEPGGIVYPIAYLVDGFSFTFLSTTQADLLSNDYILNVHLSEAEPGTYVSCAALETADDGGTTGLPNTGTGGATDSNAMGWLIAGLAVVGIGGVIGAGFAAGRRR